MTNLPGFRPAWSVTKLPDGLVACAADKSAGSEPACAVDKLPDDPMACAMDKSSCPDRTWSVTNLPGSRPAWSVTNLSGSRPAWSVTNLPDSRPAWSVTNLSGSRPAWSVAKPDAPAPTRSSARSVRPSRSTRCSARTNTGVSAPSNGDIRVWIASRSRTASAPAPERPVTARTSRGRNLPWRQAKAKALRHRRGERPAPPGTGAAPRGGSLVQLHGDLARVVCSDPVNHDHSCSGNSIPSSVLDLALSIMVIAGAGRDGGAGERCGQGSRVEGTHGNCS